MSRGRILATCLWLFLLSGPAEGSVENTEFDRVEAAPGCDVLFPSGRELPREWIVDRCRKAALGLRERIPVAVPSRIHVYVAPTDEEFRDWTGGQLPEWGVGAALPAKRRVVLRFTGAERERAELDRVMKHELAHVMLAQACADQPVPRWFDEGVAMSVSEPVKAAHVWTLARAVMGEGLVPLVKLERGFPRSESLARLAYAQGRDAIRFIEERWGHEAVVWMFRDLSNGSDFADALRRNTGFSPVIFGLAWERDAKERYGPLGLLHDSAALWVVVAVAVVIGGIVRRRRVGDDDEGEALDAGGEGPAHWPPASIPAPGDGTGTPFAEG